jgi:hypothetical protein
MALLRTTRGTQGTPHQFTLDRSKRQLHKLVFLLDFIHVEERPQLLLVLDHLFEELRERLARQLQVG